MRHEKSALFGSEIDMERSHSIFCTNRHKMDITTVLKSSGAKYINTRKTMKYSMLHRHLIFSFVYWYSRQVLLLMICTVCIVCTVTTYSRVLWINCVGLPNLLVVS